MAETDNIILADSRELGERIRRRAYLMGLGIGAPVVVLTWFARSEQSAFVANTYPLLTVFLCAVIVLLWGRLLSVPTIERVVLVGVGVFFLGQLAFTVHTQPTISASSGELGEAGYLNVTLLFLFAFLAFDTRTGLRVSLAIYAFFVAIVGSKLALQFTVLGASDGAFGVVRVATYYAAIVIVLYALAQVKDQLAVTHTAAQTFSDMAHTDELTGLANRRHLQHMLEAHLADAKGSRVPLTAILVDVDRFKSVNDRFGHAVGDHVLRGVAATLAREVREGDIVGRWGGEEFLILAPATGGAPARRIAERCREMLAREQFDDVGGVTASFGVATSQRSDTPHGLLARADDAVYDAKHAGRNRVSESEV